MFVFLVANVVFLWLYFFYRRLILEFLKDTDSGVLCQVTRCVAVNLRPSLAIQPFRLVQTCCSYEELQSTWLPQIMESKFVKDSLLFILQGSTNGKYHIYKLLRVY